MSPINREPVALLLLSVLFAITLPFSFASNGVCTATGFELYTYTLYSSASRTVYYDEHYSECCGWFCWSTCSATLVPQRTEYYKVSYTQPAYRSDIAYQCCAGFVGSPATACLPICSPSCVHGQCTEPNICTCNSGWTGGACDDDVNECLVANGGCSHLCTNTPGSFYCTCKQGFTLAQNGLDCNDINECAPNGGLGPCAHICTNTPGSFQCGCNAGYTLSGYACIDINECALNGRLGPCAQICTNTPGSFQCSCSTGYTLSGYACNDINECATANGRCQQNCNNTIGSYLCSCRRGYQLRNDSRECNDINECLVANGGCSHLCTNRPGSFYCTCKQGFTLAQNGFNCNDIPECSLHTDNCSQICVEKQGGYSCSCKTGYRLQDDGFSCKDIDECKENLSGCNQNCTNTNGSFTCSCYNRGYALVNGNTTCTDINECAPNGGLGPCAQICTNTPGSFQCSCNAGYTLSGYACIAICSPSCVHGQCTEPNICTCNSGWTGGACDDDVNECAPNGGLGPCAQICTNTPGSFLCGCNAGYTLSGYACIDECAPNADGTSLCSSSSS